MSISLPRPVGFFSWTVVGIAFFQTLVLSYIFYPGFFGNDSRGYLGYFTSDQFDHFRTIAVQYVFAVVLRLSHGDIFAISVVQVLTNWVCVLLSVRIMFPELSHRTILLLGSVLMLFSARTFMFQYWIHSEGLYGSAALLWSACIYRSLVAVDGYRFLCVANALAVVAVAVRPSGAGFLVISVLLTLVCAVRNAVVRPVAVLIVCLIVLFGTNYMIKGNLQLTNQLPFNLLLSGNKYIDYDSDYLAGEKAVIKPAHLHFLKRAFPNTRPEEILWGDGTFEGLPYVLAKHYSGDGKKAEAALKGLITEGLMKNCNLIKYLAEGAGETWKLVSTTGDIGPAYNRLTTVGVTGFMGSLEKIRQSNLVFVDRPLENWEKVWLQITCKIFVLPRPLALVLFLLLSVWAIGSIRRVSAEVFALALLEVTALCHLLLSATFTYALDRLWVHTEQILLLTCIGMGAVLVGHLREHARRFPAMMDIICGLGVVCVIGYHFVHGAIRLWYVLS